MNKCLLVAALVPALIPSCTTAPPPAATADAPLAEVELPSGAVVSFYETSPGSIAISEQFAIGENPVPTIGRSAVDVYRSIAGDRPVPEALVAAQARAVEARASRPHPPLPPPRENWINNTTIDDQWFANNFCGGSWDNIWCRLNQTVAIGNNTTMVDWDTDEFYLEGCSDRGEEDLWANVDDTVHWWTLTQGYCRYYHWTSGWLNVFSASGAENLMDNARYHISMRTRH